MSDVAEVLETREVAQAPEVLQVREVNLYQQYLSQ